MMETGIRPNSGRIMWYSGDITNGSVRECSKRGSLFVVRVTRLGSPFGKCLAVGVAGRAREPRMCSKLAQGGPEVCLFLAMLGTGTPTSMATSHRSVEQIASRCMSRFTLKPYLHISHSAACALCERRLAIFSGRVPTCQPTLESSCTLTWLHTDQNDDTIPYHSP